MQLSLAAAGRPLGGRHNPQPFTAAAAQVQHRRCQGRQSSWRRRAAPEEGASPASGAAAAAPAADGQQPEEVFYEGRGANSELALSLLLGATLIYLPLTLASVGRRLWISYKFTDRRLVVTTDSPVFKREIQVEYNRIKEIRTAPRAFGAWGDMVIFLKDGSRLELVGLERYQDIKDYIYGKMPPMPAE